MKKISVFLMLFFIASANLMAFKENLLFTADINGSQAIPMVTTQAKGLGSFMLNKARNAVSVNISLVSLSGSPTSIEIYQGNMGANGTFLMDLSPFLVGNRLATTLTGTSVTANLAQLFNDELYVLVKTAANPLGEIRGQITLETDLNFVADLNMMETIPMIMTGSAYGLGSFGLSIDKSTLDFNIICQGLSGPITGAKLYSGTIGMLGIEVADLSSFINGRIIRGNIAPTASMLNDLLIGEVYLNITTATNPTGELRSQLVNYKGLTFDASIDGGQMVPPVTTPAKGVCVIRFSPDLVTMYYDIVIDSVISSIDYAHLHIGNYGQPYNSSSFQVDFTNSINGNRIKGTKTGISALNKDKLLISNLALIIHTSAHPGGELRGQIIRYAREGYTINMEGGQVVPIVGSNGYGSGIVSIDRDESNAHYNWLAGNLSSPPTSSSFKKNILGQNGIELYDLTPEMMVVGNNVSASGYWKNSNSVPFLLINAKQFSADSIYLEIQNATFPNGEIRGQVLDDYVTITLAIHTNFIDFDFNVYPNPCNTKMAVSLPEFKDADIRIELFDMLGQVAFSEHYVNKNAHELSIDVSNLAKGNYLLKVSNKDKFATKKIVLTN